MIRLDTVKCHSIIISCLAFGSTSIMHTEPLDLLRKGYDDAGDDCRLVECFVSMYKSSSQCNNVVNQTQQKKKKKKPDGDKKIKK